MKNINISMLLGCCIISIGIIIAGTIISNSEPPVIQGSFGGSLMSSDKGIPDYFDDYAAASFILCTFKDEPFRMDMDAFEKLLQSGDLDWTYTTVNGKKVFSKEKLSLWLQIRIENSIRD